MNSMIIRGRLCNSPERAVPGNKILEKMSIFLLLFLMKWSKIELQVEESGEKGFKVVDKLITLWKS